MSSQRASAPPSESLRRSISPSGPSASNRQIIRRIVITETPSSAAFASFAAASGPGQRRR
jgi:hypothetical protein